MREIVLPARRRGPAASRRMVLQGLPAGALLAAACGQSGSTGAADVAAPRALKSGVTVQWGIETGQTRLDLRNRQTQMFEKQFPGIKVEQIVNGSNVDKIKSTIAAGTPMDLIRITTTQFAGYANQGAVIALDSRVKRDKYDLKDFFPGGIAQWEWRGKLWAQPFLGILTPYVNLDVVERSGARKPPNNWKDPTWTWDAFVDFCTKCARRDGSRTVQWGFAGTHNNWRYYMSWVWANGGDMFDKDLKQVTLGDPPALEALQFLGDLINKHRVAPTPDELKELGSTAKSFTDGKSAIDAESVNMIATNRATQGLRWTITAFPRGKKGIAIGGGGVGWLITAGSRLPDETWELLKVVQSVESDKLTALMGEAPPSRRSVARDPEFLNPKEAPGADMKVLAEALDTAMHTDTVLIQGDEIFTLIGNELAPLWAGQRSAREVTDIIKQKVTPMLAAERA